MSNIGINTNTFRVTGKYLDLLNDFLVKAKINRDITEIKKEQLIDFFTKVSDNNSTIPQFQLLSSILERELRNDNKRPEVFFPTLIEEIQANNIEVVLPKVSFIAEALDSENSVALAKIKG